MGSKKESEDKALLNVNIQTYRWTPSGTRAWLIFKAFCCASEGRVRSGREWQRSSLPFFYPTTPTVPTSTSIPILSLAGCVVWEVVAVVHFGRGCGVCGRNLNFHDLFEFHF